MHYYKLVQDIISYINDNITEDLSLKALAKRVNFSSFHFHRLFVSYTGKTPMEYIRRKRITLAAADLLGSNISIGEISGKYKFDSQDGFCRAFKRYCGMTPGEYRNSNFKISYEKTEDERIMYAMEIYYKMKCSFEEKLELIETIERIIELSETARSSGLMSLEPQISYVGEAVFKKAIQMLIDGIEPSTIKELLLNYCLTGGYTNKEFLRRILIIEGMLLIQKGANSQMILEKLSSYMGEDFIVEVDKHFGTSEELYAQKLEEMKRNNIDKPYKTKETSLLEGPVGKMDSRSLQRLLREIDEYTLVRAVSGASGGIQAKILSNVSKRSAIFLLREIDLLDKVSVQDIAECQKRIVEIMNKLSIEGEIRL